MTTKPTPQHVVGNQAAADPLEHPDGLEAMKRLLASCDVFSPICARAH